MITFHSIDDSGSVVSFSPARLRALLADLAAEGWQGTSVSDALGRRSEPRVLGLAFDDGYRSVFRHALPILNEFGFRATVFVLAGRADRDNTWLGQDPRIPRAPLLSWKEAGELVDAGWELGSHGSEHVDLTSIEPAAAEADIGAALRIFETEMGRRPDLFAYPYGAVDARVRGIVGESHAAAVGTRLDYVRPDDLADPFDLPRLDAYYLRGAAGRLRFDSAGSRTYLALRRFVRSLRRRTAL